MFDNTNNTSEGEDTEQHPDEIETQNQHGGMIPECCTKIEPCRHVVNKKMFKVKGNVGL